MIGSKLLLVTFRSQAEGGERSCSLEEYSALCRQVCASGCADLLDLELRIGSKLLLVTFRSQAEGGERSCSLEEYSALCRQVCASGCADLLDLELRPTGDALPALIQHAHAAGVKVICSSHDFTGTPPQEELTARMEQMRNSGADIAKLAVMPHRPEDVLELLTATTQMRQVHPELPLVTMSMGALGAVSRLWGPPGSR